MELTWRKTQLQKIATEIGDGLHGTPFYSSTGMCAFINGSNISSGHIVYKADTKYVDEKEFEKYQKPLSKRTLLLSINGTLGNVAEYNGEKVILGKSACYINVAEGVNYKFVKHVLNSPAFQEYLVRFSTGTTIKNASLQQIREYTFLLPPLHVQDSIAATLSCLDDKIELNSRIIANLEAQAQAIFKSWFVDFEPFQDGEFEDSELGMIPKGWRVDNLIGIADYLNGLAMQKYRPAEGDGLPVLKIKELRQGFCDASSDRCTSELEHKYIVQDGDVIFSWSGSLMIDLWCGGLCGLNQHLFKVTSECYEKWFYYLWTKFHMEQFIAIARDKATTMGHIKREALENALVAVPDELTFAKANGLLKPMIEAIILHRIENKKLASARDTLLPKLMSGEIEVPVEEKHV